MTDAVNNRHIKNMAKTIRTKVYTINELDADEKEKAINTIRNIYYKDNNFAEWAIDDCSLFEPPHDEMVKLFGDNYNFPLLKNNRNSIYFSVDSVRYLDCKAAIEITNEIHFLTWLEVPNNLIGEISYSIFTQSYLGATTEIKFSNYDKEKYSDIIIDCEAKFYDHIYNGVLKQIEDDINYRYSDEAIIEDAEINEMFFTKTGEVFNY